ncbi:hypothetical protein SAMN05421862_1275 [Pseudomonas extremaustralis]|uniref:Uncharacterized protein n=1 Tax=Pseudomonas syringae pv. pisi str. 1704B TaxID=629263 RepID=F3G625_PSESJ|nr:hypothetical protein PSYPI_08960 [Pseudomonas syringae pv. pisi str. 1704B]SKB05786.1 hypothetical protein SAMN05421862_1275 [Pseudomonas extremaustralis]
MYILQVRRMAGKILLLRFSKMLRICAVQFVVTQKLCGQI